MEQTERLEELFFGLHDHDFSSSPETSSIGFSTSNTYASASFFDELHDLENLDEVIHQLISYTWSPEDLVNDQQSPSFFFSSESSPAEFPLLQDTEAHDESSLLNHLLSAYGEAKGNEEKDLADILIKSINGKCDAMGTTAQQRVAYHLFSEYRGDGDEEYLLRLRKELGKNYLQALTVVYESLVDSRFAHFTANSAIMESLPPQATALHVVDFDLREGIQWPPLIEAFSFRKPALLKITSIAQEGDEGRFHSFAETKERLLGHARRLRVNLVVEEKGLEDFSTGNRGGGGGGGEWFAFNCIVGLPHMGRRRPRRRVAEFLRLAKQSLTNSPGILTVGDGETWDPYSERCYASCFGRLVRHYEALFESLAENFPGRLAEARTTVEVLFLAPVMRGVDAWHRDWAGGCGIEMGSLFRGRRLSRENAAEAKLVVGVRGRAYEVEVRGHEMALKWNGVPLVKVSTWM